MKIHYSFHVFLLTFIAVIAVQEWENMKLLNESGLRGAFNPHVQPQTYCNYLGFPFCQSLMECQPAKNLCFFKVLAPGIRTRPEKSLSFHSGLDWFSVSKSAKLLKPGTRNSWRSPSSEMLMKHPRKLKPQCIATEEAAPNDPSRAQPFTVPVWDARKHEWFLQSLQCSRWHLAETAHRSRENYHCQIWSDKEIVSKIG